MQTLTEQFKKLELPVELIESAKNGEIRQCYNPGRSKYIRQVDGDKVYPFSKQVFKKWATEAGAILEIGGMRIIDTEILDLYLDTMFKTAN